MIVWGAVQIVVHLAHHCSAKVNLTLLFQLWRTDNSAFVTKFRHGFVTGSVEDIFKLCKACLYIYFCMPVFTTI